MNLTKIILICCTLSIIFSKNINSLDRYDEIIAQEFTLINNEGNIVMKLSKMDFEQINNLASWIQNNSELYQKLNEAQNQLSNHYDIQIDSVNNNILKLKNKIDNALSIINKDVNLITNELKSLKGGMRILEQKNNINMDNMNQKTIPMIEEKIDSVNKKIDMIMKFDVMKKEIKKNKKAYYLP